MGNREYLELLLCNCGPLEIRVFNKFRISRLQQQRQRQCSRGYSVTWISERFMPSQINTKSCLERISFAPLRHGRYFNRDTFVLALHAEKLDFKSVKKVQAVYFTRPQKFAARFSQRVSKMFSTLTSPVSIIHYRL